MLGKVGAVFYQCHQGAGDRLAQGPLGPPWAEPGPQGDASGCRLLQPPPWHWGETLQGDRAIAGRALPPLSPRALPAQARPLMRAWAPALSPPWGLGPPPPWQEACLSPAWHSAELGPQRPHCAHPTDPLGRQNGSTIHRDPTSGSYHVGDWGAGTGCQPGPAVERHGSGLGVQLGDVVATPVRGPGSLCSWGLCLLLGPSVPLKPQKVCSCGRPSGGGTCFPQRYEGGSLWCQPGYATL